MPAPRSAPNSASCAPPVASLLRTPTTSFCWGKNGRLRAATSCSCRRSWTSRRRRAALWRAAGHWRLELSGRRRGPRRAGSLGRGRRRGGAVPSGSHALAWTKAAVSVSLYMLRCTSSVLSVQPQHGCCWDSSSATAALAPQPAVYLACLSSSLTLPQLCKADLSFVYIPA